MQRPKPNLRAGMLLWRHSLRICSVSILIGVITLIYLHNSDVGKNNTSYILSADVKDHPDQHNGGTDRRKQRFDRDKGDNSLAQDKFSVDDNDENLLSQRTKIDFEEKEDDILNKQHDIEIQDIVQAINHQIVQYKDIAQQDHDQLVLQRRHLNEMKISDEASFSPNEYPLNLNLFDILHQYNTKGYADEKPMNTFDHRSIIQPDQTCSGSDVITVLFIVKSSPDHTLKRAIIRETWADKTRFPSIRTIFSFGIPKDGKSLLDLQEESSTNNDILLVNYADNYYNLTLKTITGLRWAVTYCARALYVVSLDDDIYVAPDLLLSFLDGLPVRKAEKLYHGHVLVETTPVRDPSGPLRKWYVSTYEYPFRTYPDYIFGGFVIMSMSTVRTFTVAAMYTKLFKFEDVYLGILAAKVGIEATDNGHINSGQTVTASEAFKTLIASHLYEDPNDLKRAWKCHLSLIDNNQSKTVLCNHMGKRLNQLKSEIESIVNWMESVKRNM